MEFKNRRVTVSVGKTINDGDYGSIKWHAGISADIPDDADEKEAYDELFDFCTDQIEDYFKSVIKGG